MGHNYYPRPDFYLMRLVENPKATQQNFGSQPWQKFRGHY
jgi:hypothetical protein